jgi:Tol biopolymer transport system component
MVVVRVVLAWCVLAGCGRIGFRELSRSDDAFAPGDVTARCAQWSSFAAPVRIAELGSPTDDWGPHIAADDLTIYLFSTRAGSIGNFDLFSATRATATAAFLTPVAMAVVNSTANERMPSVTADGLTLVFTSNRTGGMGMDDVWWATRATTSDAFGPPTVIPNVNSPGDELNASISNNGLRLYISSNRSGSQDIFVADRATASDPFGAPQPIAELDSASFERYVSVSDDELEAFLVTDRAGMGDDIFYATRPDLASPWSAPVRLDELDTPMDDVGPSLSRDGTTLYFNYDAVSAGGNAEVYAATRTCLARGR